MVAAPMGMAYAQAGSKADYDATVKQADADYKTAKNKCDGMSGNAKDVCKAEAKRDHEVAKANAEAKRDGTEKAHAKAMKTKANGNNKNVQKKASENARQGVVWWGQTLVSGSTMPPAAVIHCTSPGPMVPPPPCESRCDTSPS